MTYRFVGLGAKFAGPCLVCRRRTGDRPHELAETILYKSSDKYGVAHPGCVGAATKSKISGGRVLTREPEETIEVG